MYWKNLGWFAVPPGSTERIVCRVCGAPCIVSRNQMGASGWAATLARRYRVQDVFSCPCADQGWHRRAAELVRARMDTPFRRVAELIQGDLVELREEHT